LKKLKNISATANQRINDEKTLHFETGAIIFNRQVKRILRGYNHASACTLGQLNIKCASKLGSPQHLWLWSDQNCELLQVQLSWPLLHLLFLLIFKIHTIFI